MNKIIENMIEVQIIFKKNPNDRYVRSFDLEEFIYRFFPNKKSFISSIYLITEKDSIKKENHFLYDIAKEIIEDFDKNIGILTKAKEVLIQDKLIGIVLASEELQEKRLKICGQCDQNDRGRCMACGCYITGKVKFLKSYCPRNYWEEKTND